MKNIVAITGIIVLFALCIDTAEAQRTSRSSTDDYFDDRPAAFKDRLWYGGGFNIGFQGSSFNGRNSSSAFNLGVSPKVGYKFNKWLSAGPRAELLWLTQRYDFGSGDVVKFNTFNVGIGPFLRAKPLENFFAQAEFQYLNVGVPGRQNGSSFETVRLSDERFWVGAGYTSGGAVATELVLLYDLLDEGNTANLPIDFRFGLTWNF